MRLLGLQVLLLLAVGCPSQAPEDGCSNGYADGYDLGWSHGEACFSPSGSVECSGSGVDFCDYAQAYDHCFGIGFLDGFRGAEDMFEDCETNVAPCSGDLGSCGGL